MSQYILSQSLHDTRADRVCHSVSVLVIEYGYV